jgi:hypothetical protein
MTAVGQAGMVHFLDGQEYLVQVGFDGESKDQQADFRRSLPLISNW